MNHCRPNPESQVAENIEYGEAILAALHRKAERQVELIALAHDENMLNLCRLVLDIQAVQEKLVRERYRLSLLRA